MDALTQFVRSGVPAIPPDEVFARVDNYLRAYRVPAARRAQLVPLIVDAAARRHAAAPAGDLSSCAIDEAQKLVNAWIDQLVPHDDLENPARRLAHGRAALHLAGVPERWPGDFLASSEPPAILVDRLRSAYLEAGPDLEFSSMVPRPIELGIVSEVADSTWKTFDKWPVLRGLFLWGIFGALLVSAFYLVRF